MINSNFDGNNLFNLITIKNDQNKVNTLLNDLFKDNKETKNLPPNSIKNIFSDPKAELSKYAQLAIKSTNLGDINPNQMSFTVGG
jgi:hypothetical protein